MKYFVSISFNTSELFQINGNEIKLSIKSKPEHGKANQELLKLLSNYFQVSSDKIKIIQGIKSRKKIANHNLITYPDLGHLFYPSSRWITAIGPMDQKVLENLFGWLSDPIREFKKLSILSLQKH